MKKILEVEQEFRGELPRHRIHYLIKVGLLDPEIIECGKRKEYRFNEDEIEFLRKFVRIRKSFDLRASVDIAVEARDRNMPVEDVAMERVKNIMAEA